MPGMFDLTSFARDLRQREAYPELVQLIQSQMHTDSRLADLRHAGELTALLDELELNKTNVPRGDPSWDAFINAEGAVLAQAIILYARATDSRDRGRTLPFDVKTLLTEEQQAVHQALLVARDKAIAHFDAEDQQDWHTDRLVLTRNEDGSWHYGLPYSRTTFRTRMHRQLTSVLHVLLPGIDILSKQSMDALNAKLMEAIEADPALDTLIEAHPFDAEAFYGTSAEAAAATKTVLEGGDGNHVWHTDTFIRPIG